MSLGHHRAHLCRCGRSYLPPQGSADPTAGQPRATVVVCACGRQHTFVAQRIWGDRREWRYDRSCDPGR